MSVTQKKDTDGMDRDHWMDLLRRHGGALYQAPGSIKRDREAVMIAVEQWPLALALASPQLKRDVELRLIRARAFPITKALAVVYDIQREQGKHNWRPSEINRAKELLTFFPEDTVTAQSLRRLVDSIVTRSSVGSQCTRRDVAVQVSIGVCP